MMNKLAQLLTFLAAMNLAVPAAIPNAVAALSESDLATQPLYNLFKNPGFENGAAQVSSTVTPSVAPTYKSTGNAGLSWNSTSAAQYLYSTSYTIPNGWKGMAGVVSCEFKVPSGTFTGTLVANDGTTDLGTPLAIANSATGFVRTTFPFSFPTSGTVRWKIASVASNEPAVYIDNCVITKAEGFNLASISQAQALGKHVYDVSAQGWQMTANGTYANFSANASIPTPTTYGSVATVPGTKIPAMVLPSGGPGTYTLTYRGMAYTSTNQGVMCRWHDGTTAGDNTGGYVGNPTSGNASLAIIQSSFYYSTPPAANTTFQIQCRTVTGLSSTLYLSNVTTGELNSFEMTYTPSGSAAVYKPEVYNWRVDANISGANASLGTSNVTSYTGIESGSWTLTNNSGSGVVNAMIACSSTNPATGTTCSSGNESFGITFTPPTGFSGDVRACAHFSHIFSASSASALVRTGFQVVKTGNSDQTISQEGKSRILSGGAYGSSNSTAGYHPYQLCGTFTLSPGANTLRVMYEQAAASLSSSSVQADQESGTGQPDIHWEVYPINAGVPPVLIGGTPTIQKFTSGSGTYTTPVGVRYLRVRMVGGGAAGATNALGSGAAGSDTTFGTSLLTAKGGSGGASTQGGAGGVAGTINSPAVALLNVPGGSGGGAILAGAADGTPGGVGGNSCFGGGGYTIKNGTGGAGATNTGGGGGGGGGTSSAWSGSGGGAGNCIEAVITNPSSSYSYSVGAGGTGAGTGGSGAAGAIYVEENY